MIRARCSDGEDDAEGISTAGGMGGMTVDYKEAVARQGTRLYIMFGRWLVLIPSFPHALISSSLHLVISDGICPPEGSGT